MKTLRLALTLTFLNLILLTGILAGVRSPSALGAQSAAPRPPAQTGNPSVLRVRVLEIVDERGTVRSRLKVEPDGEVVFRMSDRAGTIRVKLGADEAGSGLLLLDEATEPAVHILARRIPTQARRNTTGITLRSEGKEQIIRP